jgi:hypothetical protein
MARGTPPTHYGFSLNNCGAAGQRSGQRHYSGTLRTILPCLLAVKGVYSPNPALFFIAAGEPDSSRIDFASRLARRATRRATTAADGDGAGKSSSLLILCLLRKRRSSLLISLPFSLYFSAPFSLLFRQPPHICFLPFFTNVPSSPHTSSHMFGHHPATGQLAGRNVPSGTQDLRALRLWQRELPAVARTVARTAVELHGCCARVTFACRGVPPSNTIYIDGVARASSAGTNGSNARSLVLHAILAPVVERTHTVGADGSEDQLGLETTTKPSELARNRKKIADGYATGSAASARMAYSGRRYLPTSSASARSSCSSRNWVLRRESPRHPPSPVKRTVCLYRTRMHARAPPGDWRRRRRAPGAGRAGTRTLYSTLV